MCYVLKEEVVLLNNGQKLPLSRSHKAILLKESSEEVP